SCRCRESLCEPAKLLWKKTEQIVGTRRVQIKRQFELAEHICKPTRGASSFSARTFLDRIVRLIDVEFRDHTHDLFVRHQFLTRCDLFHNIARFIESRQENGSGASRLIRMCIEDEIW